MMNGDSCSRYELIVGELEIMKSAYASEFEIVQNGSSSNEHFHHKVKLKLGPHHTQGGTLHSHVFAVLQVSTSPHYPDEPAEVIVESCCGITDEDKFKLEVELKSLCGEFSKHGTVVMMELSQHTQNFLSEHARPCVKSVYDEMIEGQKAKEKALQEENDKILKEQAEQEQEKRIFAEKQIKLLKEAMKKQKQETREKLKFVSLKVDDEREMDSKFHLRRSTSDCITESEFNETFAKNITFTSSEKQEIEVYRLSKLRERPEQLCEISLAQGKSSKELFALYSWSVRVKKIGKVQERNYLLDDFLTKLYSLEKEMNSILKLSHENLVPFEAIKIVKPQNDILYIHILREYVQGHSLKVYFNLNLSLSESLIQHISSGIVNALDFLHSNNVVHRDIRDSCVFLDHEYNIVRLANYSIERRCIEAIMEYEGEDLNSSFPASPGRGGKKGDVFRLGLLLLSLSQGNRIQKIPPNIPSKLSSKFRDFLNCCLDLSEQDRWTAHQLVEHPFIVSYTPTEDESSKKDYENKACIKFCLEDKACDQSLKEENKENDLSMCSFDTFPNFKASRFLMEYNFIEKLGKGGFGHVYKVRNKVDDRIYAVKQISLHHKSEATRRKMIREVKLLSSLNHENVVRYYTSWIEKISEGDILDRPDSSSLPVVKANDDSSENNDGFVGNFVESESEDEELDWLMASRRLSHNEEESDDILFINTSGGAESNNESVDEVDAGNDIDLPSKPSPTAQTRKTQYLFIQMQYCEKNTLRQAIDHGLYLEEDRVWRLFREIVNGLDYIHSQGLIHRDLKPGNLFLDSSDHVKIGDFGLATVAYKDINAESNILQFDLVSIENKESSAMTGLVGTTLYIAPELTKVTGKVSYTNKVDIYSLGIILFEMFYKFSTGMERVKLISSLRLPCPQFPEDFSSDRKKKLILWLLAYNTTERPSTKDLLSSPLLPPPTAEEQKFMAMLDSKIKNVNCRDYQDILQLLFRQSVRPELQATFEFYIHKESLRHLLVYDFVRNHIISIFRSHGGIFVPISFYIPKGTFYENRDNALTLMTRGGEMITSQYELRYPFARYVARSDVKHMRRYCIDRVQRSVKVSGVHPVEIYECAFDIVSPKYNKMESLSRIILIAQDVLMKISGLNSSEIIIKLGHSELLNIILKYSGTREENHQKVFELLFNYRLQQVDLDYLGKLLRSVGIGKKSTEILKDFYRTEGSVDQICVMLQSKILSSSSRQRDFGDALRDILTEIKELRKIILEIGVQFDVVLQPLLVVDHCLYQGISFQLILRNQSKKSAENILAQGGSYEHLIASIRNKVLSTAKRSDSSSTSAVGISLPLKRVIGNLDLKKLTVYLEEYRQKNNKGHYGNELLKTEIFICAVEERQLKERISLVHRLSLENIIVDHGFAIGRAEAEILSEEYWFIPYFVFLYPDKVILRNTDSLSYDRAAHINERKINLENMFEFLCRMVKSGKGTDSSQSLSVSRKESIKTGSFLKSEDFSPNIYYLLRKQTRPKDLMKLEEQISAEVIKYISRCLNITANDIIEVYVLDLEKKVLLSLSQLDFDTTVKEFNESAADIFTRFPDIKDYLNKIFKSFVNSLFYKKKSERPAIVFCFSTITESLRRIF